MSGNSDIRLFVIIPVYGNWEDTLDCLGDLSRQSNTEFQVLIGDDGSPSPPPAGIRDFQFADYLRNPHRGFAANANVTAAEAIRRGATHLLFLNSDTSFGCEFIEGWLRSVRERPGAILSPIVYWFRDPARIWFSGGKQTIWTPFFRMRRGYREATPVDIVTGCALLVPVSCWRGLEGFSERYEMYFEDFDFTLRAKRRGIETYVIPGRDIEVRHKVGGSFRSAPTWTRRYCMLRSSLIFIRSHYRGVRKLVCFGLSGLQILAMLLLGFPHPPNARLLWRAIMRGLSEQDASSATRKIKEDEHAKLAS